MPPGMWRYGLLPLTGELPETAEPVADAQVEAALTRCSQLLARAASRDKGFCLREVRDGLRITEEQHDDIQAGFTTALNGTSGGAVRFAISVPAMAVLLFPWIWKHWLPLLQLAISQAESVAMLAMMALLFLLVFVRWLGVFGRGPPVICATVHVDASLEDVREALADPWRIKEWMPQHLGGRLLTLVPGRDEVFDSRFRVGLGGMVAKMKVRRRWSRGSDGARILCCVAEPHTGGGSLSRDFEGFAVMPFEEGGCTVAWLCGLDLVPWAPQRVREEVAVRRVAALAGLREWLACFPGALSTGPSLRQAIGAGPQLLPGRCASGGLIVPGGVASSSSQQVSSMLLRAFRRAPAGCLHAPADLERACLSVELLLRLAEQFLRGGREAAISAKPHGLLPQAGPELVQRYAARWAYASSYLLAAGSSENVRERLKLVVAFMVAGLHLTAAGYPYLPWVVPSLLAGRHTAKLPDESRLRLDVKETPCESVPNCHIPRASFEVVGQTGSGFRISGTDQVSCHASSPGTFEFADQGTTTVEFAAGSSCPGSVCFSMPQLRVRPSGWRLGAGSTFEWIGSAHFVDELGGVQCELRFGSPGEQDAVSGSLKDAHGFEVGRFYGSWLGPLRCDEEVLWRGPRAQLAPC
ncbi:unnamed protein product [Polarella glacialis]|uniref:Uncharacterized protein n=1 Tax=Polarella glacialis TaxID=89957 RepID=A0A813D6B5_POLGL|nr:unnamed protein product [Polarella glacialis]